MKKNILWIIVILLSTQAALSQVDYHLAIERGSRCGADCIIATDNNEALVGISIMQPNEFVSGEIIKIDAEGNLIDSLILPQRADTSCGVSFLGKASQPNHYIGMGLKYIGPTYSSQEKCFIYVFEFDSDCNMIWEKIIDSVLETPYFMECHFWNDAYFLSVSGTPLLQGYLYKTDTQGNILLKEPVASPVFFMCNIPGTSHFLMNKDGQHYDGDLSITDETLNNVSNIHLYAAIDLQAPLDLEYINDSEFIMSGQVSRNDDDPYEGRRAFCVKKYNASGHNTKCKSFGYEGCNYYNCYQGQSKTLAMQQDYFFFGGSGEHYPFPAPDFKLINFIMIYAFNHNLDSLWSTTIGHDAYYYIYHTAPTPDGGCLLAGFRYDWCTGRNVVQTSITKIAKPDFTHIHEQTKKVQVSVYPNPGSGQIYIDAELSSFIFQLYAADGQLVLTQNSEKEIDAQHLVPGLYVYRIIGEKGEMASGKWIKR